MTITTELSVRETLPPVPCHPWCTDGNGHANEVNIADQTCIRTIGEDELILTAMEPHRIKERDGSISAIMLRSGYVELFAYPYSTRPLVDMGVGVGERVRLTVDEARELGRRLLEAAELAGTQR